MLQTRRFARALADPFAVAETDLMRKGRVRGDPRGPGGSALQFMQLR